MTTPGSRTIHLGFSRERVDQGMHMCMIFNGEEERRDIIAKFLAAGVEDGDRIGYFSDVWELDDLRGYLSELGVDIDALERKRAFSLDRAPGVYHPDGVFSPEAMWSRLQAAYRQAVADGYPGLRLSGEMSWSLKGVPGSEKLVDYESGVNRVIQSCPFTAICQYDANRFDGATLMAMLRVHPFMLARGQVVRNPYYEDLAAGP